MEIKNGRIARCTEAELFLFWMKRWSNIIDYYSFKKECKRLGTVIVTESEEVNDNE